MDLEKKLDEIVKCLKNLESRNEIPNTANDLDDIDRRLDNMCQKLDTIIELLKNISIEE